jgi:uncharacterized protein YndB with AHSA1/START domain
MSMQTTMPPVRKTVTVRLPVDRAFALFTARMDQWWPLGGAAAGGTVVLEPRPQGLVYRRYEAGRVERWGEVRVWEPPHRFVVGWQPAPDATPATEVEVRFLPEATGTRVELEHRGWDEIGAHGAVKRSEYDSAWEDALRNYVSASRDNGPAIASLILGIASLVLPLVGLVFAPFAIGFGIAGRRRARKGAPQGAVATAGLTLGAIGLVLWGLLVLGGSLVLVDQNGSEEQVPVPHAPTGQPNP